MPQLNINVEGEGGAYEEVFAGRRRIDLPDNIPIRIETLDGGMQGGKPSVGIIIELPAERAVVLAQTSVKLFQMAAFAMLSKYGDMTNGAVLGSFVAGGTAELTLSDAVNCTKCTRKIPSSCKFCPECGARL